MYSRFRILPLVAVLATAAALLNLSCRAGTTNSSATNASSQTLQPKLITPADLAKLRWIEGSWRGTGDIQKPFFERYHFENESTLVMESLTDESLSKVSETTRYELKDGHFGNGRSVATAIDDNSITFGEVANPRNSYRFQRESDHSWKAILIYPSSGHTAEKPINYHMERWPQKSGKVEPAGK